MFSSASVDGDAIEHVEDSVRVSLDFDWESAVTYRCTHCGAPLVETSDGFQADDGESQCSAHDPHDPHDPDDLDDLDDADSDGADDDPGDGGAAGFGPHDPERVPLSWVNSAAIDTDEKDDSVTVSISVGDPRGAFTFTVRRLPDHADGELAGRLIMHLPHPGEPLPHEPLTELRPGTHLIG